MEFMIKVRIHHNLHFTFCTLTGLALILTLSRSVDESSFHARAISPHIEIILPLKPLAPNLTDYLTRIKQQVYGRLFTP